MKKWYAENFCMKEFWRILVGILIVTGLVCGLCIWSSCNTYRYSDPTRYKEAHKRHKEQQKEIKTQFGKL